MKNSFAALVFLAVALNSTGLLQADPARTIRDFRSIEALKISLGTASKTSENERDSPSTGTLLSEAWNDFDSHEWKKAINGFLTVLEQDPRNRSAAEGLAMGVYRSGDYYSTYRLDVELSDVMPDISEKIASVVLADVRHCIAMGQNGAARELLAHFPVSDAAYAHAHSLADGAETLAKSIGSDEETLETRFAKN
ncbi:MAG: hypothetical protein WD342_15370 [Verrucomicrobiales bacterium]